MHQLGGFALYLNWSEIQLGRGETLTDTAKILSKYVDGIVARVKIHQTLEELASYSAVPVINGLSDLNHPVQILADLMTILENKRKLRGLKLAYIGDGNNICNSLLIGCSKVGVNLSIACPSEYEPNLEFLKKAKVNARENGSIIQVTRNPKLAVSEADIVYTDVFVSMGQESEREKRFRKFMPYYQVNSELCNLAKHKFIFMHPLPCHRNEEVTADVIDGSNSVVWDQAENRLHTSKSLLNTLL